MGSSIIQATSSSDWFDPRFKVATVKHPESVMICGAISCKMGKPRAGFYFLPKKQRNGWLNLKKSTGGAYAGLVLYSWL